MKPKGKLIIIGGKEDRSDNKLEMEKVNRDFISHEILKLLASDYGRRIEVITTATSEPESTQKTYEETFAEIGYNNYGFLHITKDNRKDSNLIQRIRQAQTIFFSGGDQCRICEELKESEIISLIYHKYLREQDFILAGTSAGAMCMSTVMIADAVDGEAIISNDIVLQEGLEFIDCIVDTHFVNRGRFGRLAHACLIESGQLGVGLGEDTALVIEDGHKAKCKGSGMVIIIDPSQVNSTNTHTAKKGSAIFAENLIVDILTEGCEIDLASNQFKPAAC